MIDTSPSTSEMLTPAPSHFGIKEVKISPSVEEWISPEEGVLVLSESPQLLSTRSSTTTSVQTPLSSSSTSTKFASRVLRGNLTRTQINRDPLTYYEITQVLGVGSMGSVAKVRKRAQAIGGSARKSVQERVQWERRIATCFKLPMVGGLFSFCLRQKADQWLEEISERQADNIASGDNMNNVTSTTQSTTSSEMIFAMKSIHLSRITDDTFVEELRNEICILKTLDHPHIIKAIETFDHRNQLFVIMELCSGGDLCKLPKSDELLLCLDAHCFLQVLRMLGRVLLDSKGEALAVFPLLIRNFFHFLQTRVILTPKRKPHESQVQFWAPFPMYVNVTHLSGGNDLVLQSLNLPCRYLYPDAFQRDFTSRPEIRK